MGSCWRNWDVSYQNTGVNAHAAAGDGVQVDLERHLLIRHTQAEQAADRALVAAFADAQHRVADQGSEQATALGIGEFADVHGIAGTDDIGIVGQQTPHHYRAAGGLGGAFDQVVGVLGRPDDAQPQLHGLHRPTRVAEDAKYHLRHCLGAVVCQAGRLGKRPLHEQAQQRHQ